MAGHGLVPLPQPEPPLHGTFSDGPPGEETDLLGDEDLWVCRNCTTLNTGGTACTFCGSVRAPESGPMTAYTGGSSNQGPAPGPRVTCVGYDERMLLHREEVPSDDRDVHPERPDRLHAVWSHLGDVGLAPLLQRVPSIPITAVQVQRVHSEAHWEEVLACATRPATRFGTDTYAVTGSVEAARVAAGAVVEVTRHVVAGRAANGLAVVRPPGHHAEPTGVMGFCLLNNVAVAARAAQAEMGVSRVLILDWDVHHGNGTQAAFQNDPSVLYVSLHRFDDGDFFPGTGAPFDTGEGAGAGCTLNVGWPHAHMGDAEYLAAFQQLVMPVAHEFAPELVLVSAGFDAARGDPLGGCCLSPAGYAHITHMLLSLAGGRVVLALEGGYNLRAMSHSVEACARVLVGQPPPPLTHTARRALPGALRAIRTTMAYHRRHWASVRENVRTAAEAGAWTEVWDGSPKAGPLGRVRRSHGVSSRARAAAAPEKHGVGGEKEGRERSENNGGGGDGAAEEQEQEQGQEGSDEGGDDADEFSEDEEEEGGEDSDDAQRKEAERVVMAKSRPTSLRPPVQQPAHGLRPALAVALSLAGVQLLVTPWKLYSLGNFYARSWTYAIENDAWDVARELKGTTAAPAPVQTKPEDELAVSAVILPPRDGSDQRSGNALTRRRLELILELARLVAEAPDYAHFCLRARLNATAAGGCVAPQSIVHALGLVDASNRLPDDATLRERLLHVTAGGVGVSEGVRRTALGLLSKDYTVRTFTGAAARLLRARGRNVTGSELAAAGARPTAWATRLYLFPNGFPLTNFPAFPDAFTTCADVGCPAAAFAEGDTQRELASDWQQNALYGPLHELRRTRAEEAEVLFASEPLTDKVTLDILWSIGSVALCSMVLWVQLGSLALSAAGNVMILLSFPVTFALFGTVLRFEVMTQLNLLAVFICVAVGADDVFVFTDSYKQVAVEFPELAHPDHGALRLCVAWRRAVSAMMVTSLTTSAAFFATTTSSMPSILTLGLFCGLSVLVNFAFVTTLYPALLTLHYRREGSEGPSVWERGALRLHAWWVRRGNKAPEATQSPGLREQENGESQQQGGEAKVPSIGPPAAFPPASDRGARGWGSERGGPVTPSPATPGDGSTALEFVELDTSKYRAVERAFGDAWGPWLVRHRVLILAVALVPVLALGGVATQLEPMQQQSEFFPPDWFALKLRSTLNNEFPRADADDHRIARLVWGIDGIDRSGFDINDEKHPGTPVLAPDFDAEAPGVLHQLIRVCAEMERPVWRGIIFRGQVACWPRALRAWCLNSTAGADACSGQWPPPRAGRATRAFFLDGVSPLGGGHPAQRSLVGSVVQRGERVLWWQIKCNATLPTGSTWTVPAAKDHREQFEALEKRAAALAPALPTPYQHMAEMWVLLDTIDSLVTGAVMGAGIAVSMAFAMILLSTRSWRLACLATACIAATLGCVTGIIHAAGWRLEVVESVSLSVLGGLAADYVTHYAVAWTEAGRGGHSPNPADEREHRVRAVFRHLGVSVSGGCMTTLVATVFLFPASLLLLQRFGQIVVMSLVLAYVLCNTLFAASLALVGPVGRDLREWPFRCRRRKRRDVKPARGNRGQDSKSDQ